MKKSLLLLNRFAAVFAVVYFGFAGAAVGQTVGEFRSRQSGDWNVPGPNGTWEQWNGSAWVTENSVSSPGSVTISGDGFPVIAGTATSFKDNTTNAAHVISLPSDIDPGDLLLIFWTDASVVNTTPTLPTDWTLLASSTNNDADVHRRIWYKIADGTEGTTVSTTNSFGDRSAHVAYRIAAGSYTLTGTPFISGANNDTDDNPNPPNLNPGQGSQKFLWLASTHAAESQTFSIPTSFTDAIDSRTIASSTSSDHCQTITCRRFFEAASLDVGAFSLGGDATHTAWSVAIQGIGVSGTFPNPVVANYGSDIQSSDATSHSITIPSGENDDLLVVVFSVDGNPTVSVGTGTGWTKLGQESNSSTVTGAIFWKMATGSDALTLSTTASEQSTHITYRIRGATGISGTAANGSSTNSDPPSHTGSEASYLWIATRSGDNVTVASAAPSGYSNMVTRAASGGSGASSNAAANILGTAAATQNPGTFTSGNEQWVSWTLAIQGPAPVITYVPIEYPYSSGSTFPVVAGTTTSAETDNTTSHSVSLPSGIASGDLLLVFWADRDNNNTTTIPIGWTDLYNVVNDGSRYICMYRVADGSESSPLSIITSGDERSAHNVYRIAVGTYTGIPVAGTTVTATNANPNPPSLNSGFDNVKTLWLAAAHARSNSTYTAIPTDYTDLIEINTGTDQNNDGRYATMGTVRRFTETNTEDPGTFTISQGSQPWGAFTIAIQGVTPTIATVQNTHTVTVTANVTVDEVTIESGGTVTVNNTVTFTTPAGGTFNVNGALRMNTSTALLEGAGTFSLNSGGTLGITAPEGITTAACGTGATCGNIRTTARTFNTGANYEYNGTAVQVTGNGLPATVNGLKIDNAGGGAGVTLSGTVAVSSLLELTNGRLTTGGNTVTVSNNATGAISGGSSASYISGNLCRAIAAGANTYAFPIGTAAAYAPVSMAFQAGTTAGTLCSSTTDGDHPNLATSNIDGNSAVNRYWSFNIQSGLGTANYNATFNWVDATPVDEDASFDHTTAIVGKYTGSSWTYPTVGARTTSSIEITGESGFSDFQVGNEDCIAPTFSACPSNTTVSTGAGVCTAVVNYTATAMGTPSPTVTYAFSGVTTGGGGGTGSGATFEKGLTTVTVTADNGCGSDVDCVFTVTVEDNEIPAISCSATPQTLNLNANCEASIADYSGLALTLSDNCPGVSLSQSPANGTAFTNVQTVTVTLTATDAAANQNSCTVTVNLVDNTPPTLSCPANTTLTPDPGACDHTIASLAYEAVGASDNCGLGPVTYSTVGGSVTPSTGSSLLGAVAGAGTNTIRWTATDAAGLTGTCQFTITVSACKTISGALLWKGNGSTGVSLGTVALSGNASDSDGPTGGTGAYSLTANTGTDFTITPSKNIVESSPYASLFNGVNMGDAAAIQMHLTGGTAITDAYRLVAADVNKDYVISTADAAAINQGLLEHPPALALWNAKGSWRFLPAGYSLSGGPYTLPAYPETISLTGLAGNSSGNDFFGVKAGDALESANPGLKPDAAAQPLILRVRDRMLKAGMLIRVDVTAKNFNDMAAFQFALAFDPQALELQGLETPPSALGLDPAQHFGLLKAAAGELRGAWSAAQGYSLPATAPVFQLTFKVLESGRPLREVLRLEPAQMPALAFTGELQERELRLEFTAPNSISPRAEADEPAGDALELYQNQPNPFNGQTRIGFNLPEACTARLRVFDPAGREVWRVEKDYPAGYNEELFNDRATGAGGILYYELSTPFGTLVRNMLVSGR